MIKMQLIGHLGKDALVKVMDTGSVANFSVAHTDRWKANGVMQERTTWVSCSLWDKDNIYPYLKKGAMVYIEGIPAPQTYKDDSGNIVPQLALRAFNVQLLAKPRSEGSTSAEQGQTSNNNGSAYSGDDPSDDLPF